MMASPSCQFAQRPVHGQTEHVYNIRLQPQECLPDSVEATHLETLIRAGTGLGGSDEHPVNTLVVEFRVLVKSLDDVHFMVPFRQRSGELSYGPVAGNECFRRQDTSAANGVEQTDLQLIALRSDHE